MTAAERNTYRQRLLALAKRLNLDLAQLRDEGLGGVGGEASGGLSDVPIHLADLGTHAFEEEVTLDLLTNEEHLLVEINAAWTRLEQGTFGRCEGCGQEIAKERLEALPYACLCVACAREAQSEATYTPHG
jgi:RNA polymerase-binding transcription factor DksA